MRRTKRDVLVVTLMALVLIWETVGWAFTMPLIIKAEDVGSSIVEATNLPQTGLLRATTILKTPIIVEVVADVSALRIVTRQVEGALGYQYAYRQVGGKWKMSKKVAGNSTFNSYIIGGLSGGTAGKKYEVKVRAYCKTGSKYSYSSYTEVVTKTVEHNPPIVSISNMKVNGHTLSDNLDVIGGKYTWVEFSVKNNSKLSIKLTNKVQINGQDKNVGSPFLADSGGKKKATIVIKAGETVKIRFCPKSTKTVKRSWNSVSGGTTFTVNAVYDAVTYQLHFRFNTVTVTKVK